MPQIYINVYWEMVKKEKDEREKNEGQFGRRGGSRRLTAYMIRWAREFSPMIKGTPSVPQSTIHSSFNTHF